MRVTTIKSPFCWRAALCLVLVGCEPATIPADACPVSPACEPGETLTLHEPAGAPVMTWKCGIGGEWEG